MKYSGGIVLRDGDVKVVIVKDDLIRKVVITKQEALKEIEMKEESEDTSTPGPETTTPPWPVETTTPGDITTTPEEGTTTPPGPPPTFVSAIIENETPKQVDLVCSEDVGGGPAPGVECFDVENNIVNGVYLDDNGINITLFLEYQVSYYDGNIHFDYVKLMDKNPIKSTLTGVYMETATNLVITNNINEP